MKYSLILVTSILLSTAGCYSDVNIPKKTLPYLGQPSIVEHDGKIDSIAYTLPKFSFTDQENQTVTDSVYKGKIYVADFFFTSCPTICPKVQRQMLRIYEQFLTNDNLLLLSHSIDTKYDTVATLKRYADKLGIKTPKWRLVTGTKESIFGMAASYKVTAMEDESAPGGFAHSGAITLIDRKGHIRGFYDGTDEKKTDELIKDIELLLKEK